jgi:hypothetical protein
MANIDENLGNQPDILQAQVRDKDFYHETVLSLLVKLCLRWARVLHCVLLH